MAEANRDRVQKIVLQSILCSGMCYYPEKGKRSLNVCHIQDCRKVPVLHLSQEHSTLLTTSSSCPFYPLCFDDTVCTSSWPLPLLVGPSQYPLLASSLLLNLWMLACPRPLSPLITLSPFNPQVTSCILSLISAGLKALLQGWHLLRTPGPHGSHIFGLFTVLIDVSDSSWPALKPSLL